MHVLVPTAENMVSGASLKPGGGPGAILGALFLKEFVPAGVPWVHLDSSCPETPILADLVRTGDSKNAH